VLCVLVSSGRHHSSYVDKYERITLRWGYRHHKVAHPGLHHTLAMVVGNNEAATTTTTNADESMAISIAVSNAHHETISSVLRLLCPSTPKLNSEF